MKIMEGFYGKIETQPSIREAALLAIVVISLILNVHCHSLYKHRDHK